MTKIKATTEARSLATESTEMGKDFCRNVEESIPTPSEILDSLISSSLPGSVVAFCFSCNLEC